MGEERERFTLLRLSEAVAEAKMGAGLYRDPCLPPLAAILEGLQAAVARGDVALLARVRNLVAGEPMKFSPTQWDAFEGWLLEQTRRAVEEGITPAELATEVRRAILVRAPSGAAHDEIILNAWRGVLGRRRIDSNGKPTPDSLDAKGHVANRDALIIELLTAAFRASGIGARVRKDPFRYQKDLLGVRVSHKAKGGKTT